jgi:hypothetical protein
MTALLVCLAAGLLSLAAFLPGIGWGLPWKEDDDVLLFGRHAAWSGAEILALAPVTTDESRGADVDTNPLGRVEQPVVLNATDAQRAEIVRRYRLFSRQPDEMITLMALSRMKPGELKLDPGLYQYGGLWMYPVGGLLKAASVLGAVELKAGDEGKAYYLDHPDAFARMYVVMRLYSVAWGAIGAGVAAWIVWRLTRHPLAAVVGGLTFALLPVAVNQAHEAKPHLAGTTLMLIAAACAIRHLDTGKPRWALVAGAACGAAFGMVISGLVAFAIVAVLPFLRGADGRRGLGRLPTYLAAGAVGALAYAVTNPYVVRHLLAGGEVLKSNLQNSTAMYGPSLRGLADAGALLVLGTTFGIVALGVVGMIWAVARPRCREGEAADGAALSVLFAPAALVLVQFALLAAGKPGEYARFALYPSAFLAIATVYAAWRLAGDSWRYVGAYALPLLLAGAGGWPYVVHYANDRGPRDTRRAAGYVIQQEFLNGARTLQLYAEPAPYSAPPPPLFDYRIELLPKGAPPTGDVVVYTVDRPAAMPAAPAGYQLLVIQNPHSRPAPIAWADKPVVILIKHRLPRGVLGGD